MSTEFHGWSKTSFGGTAKKCPALHIGQLPHRKGFALYEANGSVNILAWFRSEAMALRAVELIDSLTGLNANIEPTDSLGK